MSKWSQTGGVSAAIGALAIAIAAVAPAWAGDEALVLYVGEASEAQAAQAREQVAARMGYAPGEVVRAEPLAESVFGNADLWPAGGEATLCPTEIGDLKLDDLVARAEEAVDLVELQRAVDILAPLTDSLACIAPPVDPAALSRAAFLRGYALYATGDRAAAGQAFQMAAVFDAGIKWDENYPPDPQQVFNSAVLEALRAEETTVWPAFGAAEAADLLLDGGPFPANGKARPGLHQVTTRDAGGDVLRVAVVFPPGGTIRLIPLREQVDGFLAGKEGSEAIGAALAAYLQRGGDEEAYVVEPAFGRIYRFHAATGEVREIPGAGTTVERGDKGTRDRTRPGKSPTAGASLGKPNPGPILVVAGAVAGAVGAIIGGVQTGAANDIYGQVEADNSQYDALLEDYEQARTGRTVGFVIAGVGGATAAAGIPVWIAGSKGPRATAGVGVEIDERSGAATGASLMLSGRW